MPTRRRRFGHLRQLPSKRWQASYIDPDGRRHTAAETFERKRDAEQWLSLVEAQMLRGEWINPDDQAVTLDEFGSRCIGERPGLRPRTVDLYRWLFGKHISPHLGRVMLGDLDAARVRAWRAKLLDSGVSPTMMAKAYRLLRAVLMTAVDDGILARNPCRIKGAGSEPTPERPVLGLGQVLTLAESMPAPLGLLVLVTTFGSLRWGEVTALRRMDVDLDAGTLHVRSAFVERSTGELIRGLPKSRAGLRVVTLPRPIVELLAAHLAERVAAHPESLVFTGDKGAPLRRSNFNRTARWPERVAALGAAGLHFHDLRHTGNLLAAASGASLRDLMSRMGHDSMRAALISQHTTQKADRKIADALERLLDQHAVGTSDTHDDDPDDGAAGALVPAS
jgi:integrase